MTTSTTTASNSNSHSGENEKQQQKKPPKKTKKKRAIRTSLFRKVKDQQWARKLIQIKKGRTTRKRLIASTKGTAATKEGDSIATNNSTTTWVSFSALGKSIQKHLRNNNKKTTTQHPDQDSSNSRSDNGTKLSSQESEYSSVLLGANTSMLGQDAEQPKQQVIAHWLQQQASPEAVVEHWCQQQAVLAAAATTAATQAGGSRMTSCNSFNPEAKERTEEAEMTMEAGTFTATTTSIAIDERETVADSTSTPPSRTTTRNTAVADTPIPSNLIDSGAITSCTNSRLAAAATLMLETSPTLPLHGNSASGGGLPPTIPEEAAAFPPSLAPGTPALLPQRSLRLRSSTVLMTGHLRLDRRTADSRTTTVVNDDPERTPLTILKDGQLHPDLIFGGYYHPDATVEEEEEGREEEDNANEEAGEGDGTTNHRTTIVTMEDPSSLLPPRPNTVETHEHRQDEEATPMMMDTIMEETQTTPLAVVPEEETNQDAEDKEDHDVGSDADSVMGIDTTMTTTTTTTMMRLEGEEETKDDSIGSTAAAPRAMARVSTRTLGRGEQKHTPSDEDAERLGLETVTTVASSSMTTTSTIGRTTPHQRIPPPDLGIRNVYYDENDNEDSHHGTTMTTMDTGMLYLGEATVKHEHDVCNIMGVGTPECTVM